LTLIASRLECWMSLPSMAPNPSVGRTANGKLLSAAHVKR
jgi:hypothetical protein